MGTLRFGQPWHGKFTQDGLLLENGTLREDLNPGTALRQFTFYVNFGAPPPPAVNTLEAAQGIAWKNDMVLCSASKLYGPLVGSIGGANWLYKVADGTVFRLEAQLNVGSGSGSVKAVRLNSSGNVLQTIATFSVPSISESAFVPIVNQSPGGDKALLNIYRLQSYVPSSGSSYTNVSAVVTLIEFILTGGSATTYPSCAKEVLYTYSDYYTTVAWNNPENHIVTPPPQGFFSESTTTISSLVAGGYSKQGQKQVIVSRRLYHAKRIKSGADANNYLDTDDMTIDNDVLVNGAAVWSGPRVVSHSIRQYTNGTPTTLEFHQENMFYRTEMLDVRYLSNCMFSFGMMSQDVVATREVLHVHSFYGGIDCDLVGAYYDGDANHDQVTVAALNPRTLEVAAGRYSGFI